MDDTTEALLRRVEDKELRLELALPLEAIPDALRGFSPVLASSRQLVFRYGRGSGALERILNAVRRAGLQILDVSTNGPNLEEVFLELLRTARP